MRKPRYEVSGGWYHVMNRGRRSEKIFLNRRDYEIFSELLLESTKLYSIEIHAYSLMPNHYHLLIRTPKANLSQAMQFLNSNYTRKFNIKYYLEGSVFKGRFRSIFVASEEYLTELVRYIHRNPFNAGLERHLGEYPWSSHGCYIRRRKRPEFLTEDLVLIRFGQYETEARKRLATFVSGRPPEEFGGGFDHLEGFFMRVLDHDKKLNHNSDDRVFKKNDPESDLEKLLYEFEVKFGVSREELKKPRFKEVLPYRKAMIYITRRYFNVSYERIRKIVGDVSKAAISKQYQIVYNECKEKKGAYPIIQNI